MVPTPCDNCAANAVHHGIIVEKFWSEDRGPVAKLITCKGPQDVCTGTEVTVGDLLMYKQHPTFGLRLEEPITKIVPSFQDLEVFDGGLTLVAVFSYTFPDLFLQRARNGKPVSMNHDVLCKMVFPQPQLLDTKCEYKIAVAYYELTNARGIPFVAIGYRPAQSDRFQKFDFTSLQNENAREDCDAIFRKFDEEYTKSRSRLQAREAAEIMDLDIISFESSPPDSAGPSRQPASQPVRGPSGRPQQPPAPAWSGSGTSPEMVNAADLDDQPAPTVEPPQFSGDESEDDEEESISFRRVARTDRPQQQPPQPAARPQARDSDYVLQRASMILEHIVQTEGQPPQQPQQQQQQPPQQQQQQQTSGHPALVFNRLTRAMDGPAAPQLQKAAASQAAAQPPSERQPVNATNTNQPATAPAPVVPPTSSNAPPPRPAAPPTRPSVPPARPAAPPVVQRAQPNAPSGQPTIPSDPLTREDQELARTLMGGREDVRAAFGGQAPAPNVPLVFPRERQFASMNPQPNSVAEALREVHASLPQGWQPPSLPANWREIPAFRPPQHAAQPAARQPPPPPPPSVPRGEGSWTIPCDFDNRTGASRPRRPQWNNQVDPRTMRMPPASRPQEDHRRFAPRQQEAARPFAERYSREFAEDTHQRYDHFGGRPAPRQPPARRPQQPAAFDRRRVDEDGFARRGDWSWAAERTAPSNPRRERPPQRRISPATAVRSMTTDELFAVITKDQMCGLYAQLAAFGAFAPPGGPSAAFSQSANRAGSRGERGGSQSARNRDDRRPTREVRVIGGSRESDEDPAMARPAAQPAARRVNDRQNANFGGAAGGQRARQGGERTAAQPRSAGGYTRGNFSASDDESEDEEEFEDARSEQYNGNRATRGNAHGSPLDFIESSGDEA